MNIIETIYVETIQDLHQILSPIGKQREFFLEKEQYFFRGEDSDQYSLLPSLFRDDTIELLYSSLRKPPIDPEYYEYEETYQWIELKTLIKFFRLANNAGIPLPEIPIIQSNIIGIENEYTPGYPNWLPEDLLDLLSLARHYSFPTRMLDWSDNIYTALYFACSNSLRLNQKRMEKKNLVLYALHSAALKKTDFPIRFVRPLRFYNPNAHAQGGVLSYLKTENLIGNRKLSSGLPPLEELHPKKMDKKPLDKQISTFFSSQEVKDTMLYKMMIDYSIVSDLYLYLDSLHYSAENIFPDLYGVVRKMMEDDPNWAKNSEPWK